MNRQDARQRLFGFLGGGVITVTPIDRSPFLEVRTAALNETLGDAFHHRYPGFRLANSNEAVALAA